MSRACATLSHDRSNVDHWIRLGLAVRQSAHHDLADRILFHLDACATQGVEAYEAMLRAVTELRPATA